MEIFRTFVERRVRTALAVSGIVIGILALTLTGAMAEHFDAQLAGGIAYYSSNVQVADDSGSSAGIVSLTKIDAIQALPGVAVALPSITLLARPGTIIGTPLGLPDTITYSDPKERAYSRLKTAIASGHQLDNKQGEVVLGADVANEFRVKVGDSLDLPVRPRNANPDFVNHPYKVVGVLKKTYTLPDATAEVGLLDAQAMLQESLPASFRDRVDPSSLATGITVYGKPGTNLDKLADLISTKVPGVAAVRPTEYVASFDQGARFTAIAAVAGALAVLFGGVVLVNTLLLAVAERGPQIALKMTFGARTWHIVAEVLLEATVLSLAGGLVGFGVGWGLADLLDLAGRTVSMDIFLVTDRLAKIALGLTTLLGIGAGLFPALRAAGLDPDVILRAG